MTIPEKKKAPAKGNPRARRTKENATTYKNANERYRLFAAAYVANGRNGAKAAREAGYSAHSAAATATKLLKIPAIAEEVDRLGKAALGKFTMTAESVLGQLSAIIHFDIRKLFDENGAMKRICDLDDETAAALSSVEVDELSAGYGKEKESIGETKKIKAFDKNSAIEKGMKHFGLLKDGAVQINAGLVVISPEDADLG